MLYLGPLRSELKLQILIELLNSDKRLSEFKSKIETGETTILHALKELEKLSLTTKSNGVYSLTPLGVIEAQICSQCAQAAETVNDFKDFWLTHDVSSIPAPFFARIGALKNSSLIKSQSSNLEKVHETFLQVLLASKKIRGISPIFHPDYVATFRSLLNKGNSIDLILTADVLNKTLSSSNAEELQKYVIEDKLRIFLNNDLKFALTVTESSLSLGFFSLDGEYDYSNDLISLSPQAVKWGEDLFIDVLAKSARFIPEI